MKLCSASFMLLCELVDIMTQLKVSVPTVSFNRQTVLGLGFMAEGLVDG